MLFVPPYAAAAESEDVAALRRMLGELKAENRKLSQRPVPWRARRRRGVSSPLRRTNVRHLPRLRRQPSPLSSMAQPVGPPVLPEPVLSEAAAKRPLNERVRELEIGWAANENATRQIIRELRLEDRTENQ